MSTLRITHVETGEVTEFNRPVHGMYGLARLARTDMGLHAPAARTVKESNRTLVDILHLVNQMIDETGYAEYEGYYYELTV